MSSFQKVLSGRRVSIPDELSKKYGIREGDIVILKESSNGITIVPAEVVPKSG
jgi:bifunctional DNA-binding transcriptional regulator/antitoxin component of YhaV-PrlF toxin-antitoxin module